MANFCGCRAAVIFTSPAPARAWPVRNSTGLSPPRTRNSAQTGPAYIGDDTETEATVSHTAAGAVAKTRSTGDSETKKELPVKASEASSIISWREAVSAGLAMSEESMTLGLDSAPTAP